MNITHSIIESLEQRIAPAGVFTITDVDGDIVTVKTSKGTDADLSAAMSTVVAGIGGQIRKIDLSTTPVFTGTDLIVTVVKKPGGDGLVNIGAIDATDDNGGTSLDLGKVVIPGDLGQIDAGDANSNTPAVKSLQIRSLGALGAATQSGGDLTSTIRGGIGGIVVKGDIRDASIKLINNGAGTEALSKIGTLTIGGSLIGGSAAESGAITGAASIGKVTIGGSIIGGAGGSGGEIVTTGDIGAVKIAGDIVGGSGNLSGRVDAGGTIKSLTLGGSLVGGAGQVSGKIGSAGTAPAVVKIARDIIGGSGQASGLLSYSGTVASFTLGGNLVGAAGFGSGSASFVTAGVVKIAGSIVGGGDSGAGMLFCDDFVKSVFVGGSVLGGTDSNCGQISLNNLSTLTVKGSIVGGTGGAAGFVRFQNATSVLVGGSIVGSAISSGSENFNGALNNFAGKVGSLTIGGSIIGGSVSGTGSQLFGGGVGVQNVGVMLVKGSIIAGEDNSSGTLVNSGAIASEETIGTLTIGGSVIGSASKRAAISAAGPGTAPAGGTQELAIAKITIGGNVTRADITAGFESGAAFDGDSSIGSVLVKGDWFASSISAGVRDMGGTGFGGADDAILPDDNNAAIASRIASIIIGGTIGGSAAAGDSFGFVAQQIGSVKIGGSTIFTGTTATDAVKAIPNVTSDIFIREVA